MTFFRRGHEPAPPVPEGPPVEDTPAALRSTLWQLTRFVNLSAGKLPGAAVVASLQITDVLREVVATADERPLDIYAIVSLKAILNDYLPTTLRTYLGLDPSIVDVARPSGRTPTESLLEQLDALWLAATDLLVATRAQDADALLTQGSFLRTKFTGSDLDL
jgi:hypothetical protein